MVIYQNFNFTCYVQINVSAVCDDKVVYMINVTRLTKLYGA